MVAVSTFKGVNFISKHNLPSGVSFLRHCEFCVKKGKTRNDSKLMTAE